MSTIKISELATSNIALTDFFAKADANGVANKNTVQELSNLLKTVDDTAFKGSIAIADVPSENGWYFASESGTYTNCDGLVIDTSDNIAIIIVSGTFDVFNKIDIPVNITIDSIPTKDSLNAVKSGGVFDSLGLKVDVNTGKNILNPDDFVVGFVRADGTTSTSATFNNSGKLTVLPNKRYAFSKTTGGTSFAESLSRVCFYDVNGNVVSGGSDTAINNFTTPSNVVQVIVSFNAIFLTDNLQLEQNDTAFTQYQAYYEKINVKASDLIESTIESPLDTDNAVKPKSYIDLADADGVTYTNEKITDLTGKIQNIYKSFTIVDKPTDFAYTPPFKVYKNNRKFLIDFDFDLKAHSAIASTKAYYVDKVNGNNSNDGLTLATALQTLITAQNKTDVDVIYCTGIFEKNERTGKHINRDIQIIGLDSNTYITSKINNQTGSWTNTSNYYSATIGDYVGKCLDFTNLNADGYAIQLTTVNSISEVNSLQNSVFVDWGNTTIYVRTFDDRLPDADLWLLDNTAIYSNLDNRKYYFEDINFAGTVGMLTSTSAGGSKFYAKNCSFMAMTIFGQNESILQDCSSLYTLDGDQINYDVSNTVINNAIEINCNIKNTIIENTAQASTSHNGCNTIRINGFYENNSGQNIADVTNSNSWNLGIIMKNSTFQDVSFYLGNTAKAWLDSCTSEGNTTDIFVESASTVYVNDLQSDGVNGGTGTVIVNNTSQVSLLEERVLALE